MVSERPRAPNSGLAGHYPRTRSRAVKLQRPFTFWILIRNWFLPAWSRNGTITSSSLLVRSVQWSATNSPLNFRVLNGANQLRLALAALALFAQGLLLKRESIVFARSA